MVIIRHCLRVGSQAWRLMAHLIAYEEAALWLWQEQGKTKRDVEKDEE